MSEEDSATHHNLEPPGEIGRVSAPFPPAEQPIRWARLRGKIAGLILPPADVGERNIWHLRVMLIWAGVLSAAASFNSNFAVRLGASNRLIGLMSSVPALIVVLVTLPAARLIETRRRRLPWVAGSLFLHRLGYLLIALMPFFVRRYQAEVFVGLLFAMHVVLAPFNAGWDTVLAELIPERRRAVIMAQRNMILCAVVILAVPLMGRLLDRAPFPYGYQIAYGLGFLVSCLGTWEIYQLKLPESPVPARGERKRRRLTWGLVRQLLAENDNYMRLVFNTLMLDLGAWMVAPLYIIYYLRHLGASDSWVGTITAVANLSALVGYYIWQKLIPRWGENRVLRLFAPTCGFFPLWVGIWRSLPPIMFAAVINNILMPGVGLSHYNILIKVCPAERRPSYISLYTVIMNLGAFVAPMVGVALSERLGIVPMFFIGGAMRILGALLFTLYPVRVPDSRSA